MASATIHVYNYKIFFSILYYFPECWTHTCYSLLDVLYNHLKFSVFRTTREFYPPPIFSFPLLLTWLPPLPPHPHQSLFRLERLWRLLVTLSSILHLFIWSLGSVFSFPHKFIVNVFSFVYPCGCCLNLGHHYFLCGLLQKPPYLTIYFCPPSSLFSSLLSLK